MKRRIWITLLFLLLVSGGAIVNVAVAWGGAGIDSWWRTGPESMRDVEARWWTRWSPPGFTGRPHSALTLRELTVENTVFSAQEPPRGEIAGARRTRAGWPLLALEGCLWYRDPPFGPVVTQHLLTFPDSFLLGQDPPPTLLPTRVLWPGFLVNTLFYAIVLWLLIPGPFVLRRLIRRRRGRCPKCGYDLRGDLERGCPECGWNRQPEAAA